MTSVAQKTALPPGSPAWVTSELLTDTIATWQAYYRKPLTELDALGILLSVSRLIDAVQENTP